MIICLKLLLFFVLEMKFSERCKSKSVAVNSVRILVINTGGTASMVKRNGIYMPEKGAIVNVISQIPAHFTRKLDGDEDEFYFNDLNEDVSFVDKETETLIDSSNLVPENWLEILKMINTNSNYDAFIVVHGTDTLAYTAAALSFMLESFNKTVILTGAMVAFVEKHSDFQSNLTNSLLIAAKHVISEPAVFFDKHLFIATRIKKKSTSSLDAFYTPNAKPLENLCYNSNNPICKFNSLTKPGISMKVCKKIRVIKIYPGIDALFFDSINHNNTKGLILETFGTGNIPNQQWVIDSIQRIVGSGIVVVNVTQIEMGRVQNIYEGSKFLHDYGVLSGEDMTLEAAYAKLAYLLGNFDDVEEVKRLFKKPLKGEFTPN